MPALVTRRTAAIAAGTGLAMLGILPFSSAIGQQARLGMAMEEVTVGLPANFTAIPKLGEPPPLRVLSQPEISALAGAAKRQITTPHCDQLYEAVVDSVETHKLEGNPLPKEITDQWKHIFKNGGPEVTCAGEPRVIRVNNTREFGIVGAAINRASRKAGVNLWTHYGLTLSFTRPVGSGQKTSELAVPAHK